MRRLFDEWRADFLSPMPFVIWAILSVLIGFAGPFGTYLSFGFPVRLVFWSLLVAFAIFVGTFVRAFVHAVLGLRSFYFGSPLIAIILAAALPPILLAILNRAPLPLLVQMPGQFELGVFVFLCSLGGSAYRHAASKAPSTMPAEGLDQPDPEPRLLSRLPAERRGRILSISVRDHYVDLRTTVGQDRVLLRLSDAIAETDGVAGAQVHRSHWVAWEAVAGAERRDGKLILRLTDDSRIPVSKTYRAFVEDSLSERGIGIG